MYLHSLALIDPDRARLTGADHRNVSENKEDVVFLFVNNLDYLPRFVAALKKEIDLCGGKPSPF